MKSFLTAFALVAAMQFTFATSNGDILLTIDSTQVTADEFMRIYNKNSSITLAEKKSVDDYLDLFINYKLKVVEALDLGYDTVASFIKEMDGYADQLAKPYLDNANILDSFVEESYNRFKEEINASHILLRLPEQALPEDTLRVYNQIMQYRNAYVKGESFEKIIKDNSPDPRQEIGGDLGWFSAMRMVYPFEIAAYNTPVGQVSMPIRTQFGYHLIKVNDRRNNLGEVNVRHIMAMYPPNNPSELDKAAAKQKIETAYKELQADTAWDRVVDKYTEHRATASRGGSLGWMRSGMAPDKFMDVCFKMKDSVYSEPFETEYGWHIVMVDQKKPIMSYEEYQEANGKRIKQSVEVKQWSARQHINRVKEEYGSTYDPKALDEVLQAADSSWLADGWSALLVYPSNKVVFTIGEKQLDQVAIANYLKDSKLIQFEKNIPLLTQKVNEYFSYEVLQYERKQLPVKYPEYRALLEEYHDGILLFNLTEDKVWHKAVEDSAGLEAFYNGLPEKYQWEKRLMVTKYTYPDSAMTGKLIKVAKQRAKKNWSAKEVSALVCGQDTLPCISLETKKYEKGDNAVADSMNWKANTYMVSKNKTNWVVYFAEGVLPAKQKELCDARGLYTADYQTFLENEWISELRKKHSVVVNTEVLNSLKEQVQ